jgi:hypothetical protein
MPLGHVIQYNRGPRKTETSVGQRSIEVSPKSIEINFFVGFELIFIDFWPTEVYR